MGEWVWPLLGLQALHSRTNWGQSLIMAIFILLMFYLVYINVGTSYKKVITIQKVISKFSILPPAVLLMSRAKWGPKQNPKIHYLKLWIIKHFTYAHLFVVRLTSFSDPPRVTFSVISADFLVL